MKKAVAYLLPFMEIEKKQKMIDQGLNPDDFDGNDDSNYAGKYIRLGLFHPSCRFWLNRS